MNDLRVQFGDIDIYLFDQLLRGRIAPGMRVIDAGCGAVAISYLLLAAATTFRASTGSAAVRRNRGAWLLSCTPACPADNFRAEPSRR